MLPSTSTINFAVADENVRHSQPHASDIFNKSANNGALVGGGHGSSSNHAPPRRRPPPREQRVVPEFFLIQQEIRDDPDKATKDAFRAKLRAYFAFYSPFLYHQVDGLVLRHWDCQDDIMTRLHRKYGPDPPPPAPGTDTRSRLERYLTRVESRLVPKVDKILDSYGGYDVTMWAALTQKYGPERSQEDEDALNAKKQRPMDLGSRLKRYLEEHDAANVAKAETLARQYEEKEGDLRSMLKIVYGGSVLEVDPAAVERDRKEAELRARAVDQHDDVAQEEARRWLTVFLQQHNPRRLHEIEPLLAHFRGRHDQLRDTVISIFGTGSIDHNAPRLRLLRMYQKHNPSKIEEVDALLERFGGRTEELFGMMRDKYGPEPPYVPDDALRTIAQIHESRLPPAMSARTLKRLEHFFRAYDPALVANVEQITVLYRGREDEMWYTLSEKYGPEPTFVDEDDKPKPPSTRDRVHAMYQHYNPSKPQTEIDQVLQRYAGRDEELIDMMHSKFGPEPHDYYGRVSRIYEKYNPEKMADVEEVLAQFVDKEEDLMGRLIARYGPEPVGPIVQSPKRADASAAAAPTSPTMTAAPVSQPGDAAQMTTRERVTKIYQQYNPTKLADVDKVLEKFAGRDQELIEMLEDKYSVKPSTPAAAAPQMSTRERVTKIYQQYDPSKLGDVDKVLEKYAGRDQELIEMLEEKYQVTSGLPTALPSVAASPPPPTPAAPASSSQQTTRERVTKIYQQYNPTKLGDVDKVLEKFAGRDQELIEMLEEKYSVKPSTPAVAAPQMSTRERVTRIYQQHNPSKLSDVDKVLEKYAGRDQELIEMLEEKYQVTPGAPTTSSSAAASPPPPTPAAPASSSQQTTRERVTKIYQQYNPTKLGDVDKVLEKFAGRDQELIEMLEEKYSVKPSTPAVAAPQMSTRERVTRIYQQHNPSKLSDVDKVLEKYAGRDQELIEMLEEKYQAAPNAAAGAAASPAVAPTKSAAPQQSIRERVTRFYEIHNPSKLGDVDKVLEKYAGRDDELIDMLIDKYGEEPAPVGSATARPRFTQS